MSSYLEEELLHLSASRLLHCSLPHSKLLVIEILKKVAHSHLPSEVSHRFSSTGCFLAGVHEYHNLFASLQSSSHLVTSILVHNVVPPHLLLLCYTYESLIQGYGTILRPEEEHS